MVDLASLVRDIPDFPEPGIVFKDITPVLADAIALSTLIAELAEPFAERGITKVAGIEARGFTLAAPVATTLEAGFIPLRKPGKLPWKTLAEAYKLEYGTDALEMHADAVSPGEKVLIVDDVIATGGTAAAAVELLRRGGAEVVGVSVFIELGFLNGTAAIEGVPFHAILRYD
ncbi:MAG TPA: adenine phosphoribosyltransferase [Acidimicrobiia bacterium]|nr:adenine phosphoribosyltransferase [Acidimicrobiia bacterium]